jgi:hypothetical protein
LFKRLQFFVNCKFDRANFKLGGPGKIVEIDESLFAKVKHNRGRDLRRKQVWVFGMIERGTRKCIFMVLAKRDAANYYQPEIEIASRIMSNLHPMRS